MQGNCLAEIQEAGAGRQTHGKTLGLVLANVSCSKDGTQFMTTHYDSTTRVHVPLSPHVDLNHITNIRRLPKPRFGTKRQYWPFFSTNSM